MSRIGSSGVPNSEDSIPSAGQALRQAFLILSSVSLFLFLAGVLSFQRGKGFPKRDVREGIPARARL
jgi:hypothetical protein